MSGGVVSSSAEGHVVEGRTNFTLIFILVLLFNIGITVVSSDWYKKQQQQRNNGDSKVITANEDTSVDSTNERKWKLLLQKYLMVYLLATLSDWMQGPYVYALYRDGYGYEQHDIAVLFVAGFGSSMIFGSFVGGMADTGGRRNFVILFSIIYALSCVTKHFKSFAILMIGRLLGGVATSLLFSVFDSWLIRAHSDANLPKNYISKSFSWAQYGNSVIAIVAGLLANNAANMFPMVPELSDGSIFYVGGFTGPFDLAFIALVFCGFGAAYLWEENYGTVSDSAKSTDSNDGTGNERVNKGNFYDGLHNAFTTAVRSTDIMLCGAISSLFEGSMYIFVFMWTPALTDEGEKLPFGLIFSTFMVCCMAGSSIFSIYIEKMKGEQLGVVVFGVATAAMLTIALSDSRTLKFLAMNIFEGTVGMYFPIMGTLKGTIVPESQRAAIYNLFRIPLNFIVLFSLLTDLSPTTSFALNGTMLLTATGLQYWLMKRREKMGNTGSSSSSSASRTSSHDEDDDIEQTKLLSTSDKEDA